MRQIYTGIVIKSIDYNASDRIITILSSDDSFVVFKARGVNKMNSPLMKYTIPFSISEFELESKGEMSNKTLVAANRKAMETDADAFKARNADRKKAVTADHFGTDLKAVPHRK